MTNSPVRFRWKEVMDGDTGQLENVMVPLNAGWRRRADLQYKIGEVYTLQEIHERSMPSHGHYFLCVHAAFDNLPEGYMFANEEHFRKHALIKSGYCDKVSFICSSGPEALRLAAFLTKEKERVGDYCIVDISDNVVTRYTAQSQSMKSMDKKTFEESKSKVLDYMSGLLGVSVDSLLSNAGSVA